LQSSNANSSQSRQAAAELPFGHANRSSPLSFQSGFRCWQYCGLVAHLLCSLHSSNKSAHSGLREKNKKKVCFLNQNIGFVPDFSTAVYELNSVYLETVFKLCWLLMLNGNSLPIVNYNVAVIKKFNGLPTKTSRKLHASSTHLHK